MPESEESGIWESKHCLSGQGPGFEAGRTCPGQGSGSRAFPWQPTLSREEAEASVQGLFSFSDGRGWGEKAEDLDQPTAYVPELPQAEGTFSGPSRVCSSAVAAASARVSRNTAGVRGTASQGSWFLIVLSQIWYWMSCVCLASHYSYL